MDNKKATQFDEAIKSLERNILKQVLPHFRLPNISFCY